MIYPKHMKAIACLALLLFWVPWSSSIPHRTKYKEGDTVTLWSDRAGPRKNPQAWVPYDQLPICPPDMGIAIKKKHEGLGFVVAGFHLVNSGLAIQYNKPVGKTSICSQTIDNKMLSFFRRAATNEFRFNMYLDDLPVWGELAFLSGGEDGPISVYTHKKLSISYNGPYIVEVRLTEEGVVELQDNKEIEFTYEVLWIASSLSVVDRFNKYLEPAFFDNAAHWISVLNSFMLVAFLCGVVALILMKTLRNDFAKYAKNDEDVEQLAGTLLVDDPGWKQVHGDVFRLPKHLVVYAALYGSGCHLIAVTVMTLCFCLLGYLHGKVYEEPGEMSAASIMCYVASAPVAGYTSGRYYRQFFMTPRAEQKSNWMQCMLLTATLVPMLVCGFLMPLNIITYFFHAVSIPFSAMFKLFCLWLFLVFPLIVFGTMLGRHLKRRASFPCRVHSIPRQIPKSPWYSSPLFTIPTAGILPFTSIFAELYFTYSSVWRYKVYYMYGLGILVLTFLVIVVACTSIVSVYMTLNAENHHWQWVAFLSGGSTALYVLIYSWYFFAFDTEMYGFLQSVTYFLQMTLFCILLSIFCGTIGVISSSIFVRKIFSSVKVD